MHNIKQQLYTDTVELIGVTVDELIKMMLKTSDGKKKSEEIYTNLNSLVDKILLIEADFGKKYYWLHKLLASIKISQATKMEFGDIVLLGVNVYYKEYIFQQNKSTINTGIRIGMNVVSEVDLDNIVIECGDAYKDVTSDLKEDGNCLCTYQFNNIASQYTVTTEIHGSIPIKFKIMPGGRDLESLTLCGVVISSTVNKFHSVNGFIGDTAISNIELDNIRVTLGWITLRNSTISGDYSKWSIDRNTIVSHCPRLYVPFVSYNDVKSGITDSKVRFLHIDNSDENYDDEESEWGTSIQLLRLEHPSLKIDKVDDLEIIIVSDTHYKFHGVNVEDNNVIVCTCDKVIDVNGLGLRSVTQTIFTVDNLYDNSDYSKRKNCYYDSIFTMKLPLFTKTYIDNAVTLKDVSIYNILTSNEYKCSVSSFVGLGTPLEKLINTSGKLSATDRYNNEQIRNYLKFIKNVRSDL